MSLLAVLLSLCGTMDSVSIKGKYASSLCKTFSFCKSSFNPDLMEIGFLDEIVGLRYVFSPHLAWLSCESLNKNVLTALPNHAFCSQLQIKSISNFYCQLWICLHICYSAIWGPESFYQTFRQLGFAFCSLNTEREICRSTCPQCENQSNRDLILT